jgi:signal peptidase II
LRLENKAASGGRLRHWAGLAALVLCLLAVDQGTKWLVIRNLAVGEAWAPVPALANVFTITHVQNTGVAFGQLRGLGWLFLLANFAVLVGVLIYFPRIPASQWSLRLASGLIVAGDVGNLIDRLRTAFFFASETGSLWTALPRAYVTDFFDIKIWPVWNVADMCLVSGAIIVALVFWQAERVEMAREPATSDQ